MSQMTRERYMLVINLAVDDNDWEEPDAIMMARLRAWQRESLALLDDILHLNHVRLNGHPGEEEPGAMSIVADIRYLFV